MWFEMIKSRAERRKYPEVTAAVQISSNRPDLLITTIITIITIIIITIIAIITITIITTITTITITTITFASMTTILTITSTGGSLVCSAHGVPRPVITWVDGSEQAVGTVPGLRWR